MFFRYALFPFPIFALLTHSALAAQGRLENPAKDSFHSGIGIISGWHCDADKIEIVIDGRPPKEAAYGTSRKDTEEVCGDSDNGFGYLFAWGLLDEGQHRIRAFADGIEFADHLFYVGKLGDGRFVRDVDAEYVLQEFPDRFSETVITWNESVQNFSIKETRDLDYEDVDQHWEGAWLADGNADHQLDRVLIYRTFGLGGQQFLVAHFLKRDDYLYITFKGKLTPGSDTIQLKAIGGQHEIELTRISIREIHIESPFCSVEPPRGENEPIYDCWLHDDEVIKVFLQE